jgi:hypothetical protein
LRKILQYYNLETADAILQAYLSFIGKKIKLLNGRKETLNRITVILKKERQLKDPKDKKYRVRFIFENITLDFGVFLILNNNKFGLN